MHLFLILLLERDVDGLGVLRWVDLVGSLHFLLSEEVERSHRVSLERIAESLSGLNGDTFVLRAIPEPDALEAFHLFLAAIVLLGILPPVAGGTVEHSDEYEQ